ncbi:MFS transporter [Streptomyces sp. NPDC050509]|uniref:MFS transporter n=1 Tax=Streptomyces sp. NPDC050509 TaxID=3365620 RepID=UPI0037958A0A
MAAARGLLHPDVRKQFDPVPCLWSAQYDVRIQAYGYLSDHEQVAFMEGDVAERRYVAAYRTGETPTGVLAVGVPPEAVHPHPWHDALVTNALQAGAPGPRLAGGTPTPARRGRPQPRTRHTEAPPMSRTHPPGAQARNSPPPRLDAMVAALTLTGIIGALTQTLVIPIVPLLPQLLDAKASDTAWAVTATLLCGAVATPVTGRLGDMYGKRRMFLLGICLMLVGSVICALSDSLAPMIVGRALQGLAAGVVPLGVSIMREVLPAEKLPGAMSAMVGSLGVGAALGLPVSAVIVDNFDWHVLFWVSAVLSAVSAGLVVLLVPESRARTGGRFDLMGAAGLALGLVCLLLAVSKGADWGWGSGTVLSLFAAAVIVLPLWGWFQLRTPQPLVDLRTNARPRILLTNLAALALGLVLFSMNMALPQLLQMPEATGYGLGRSLIVTGLVMAPQGLVMMAVSPYGARITRSKGPKVTLMIGSAIVAAGHLVTMAMMSGVWQVIVASCVVATGVGFAYGALPALIMEAVPVSGTAAANGLNALMRSIGTTVSSAVAGLILAHMTTDFHGVLIPTENGLRAVLALGAGAGVLTFTLASLIPRGAPTEVPAPPEPAAAKAAGAE